MTTTSEKHKNKHSKQNVMKKGNFFKTFKEELISIPTLLVVFFLVNGLLTKYYPNSAFFDFPSQMETLVSKLISFVVLLTFAWIGLRITFPQLYRYLRVEFYHKFNELVEPDKRKYAVIIFLVFVLSMALISRASGETLDKSEVRYKLVQNLETQLKVREVTPNKGPMVDLYLHSVGINQPAAWCAAFVSYNLQQLKIPNPKSAWSPDYAKPKDLIYKSKGIKGKPQTGDVVTYYYTNLGRVGHVGFYVTRDKDGYMITIEGNTNGGGSREGDGVYKKKRDFSKAYAISRYIKPKP